VAFLRHVFSATTTIDSFARMIPCISDNRAMGYSLEQACVRATSPARKAGESANMSTRPTTMICDGVKQVAEAVR